MTFSCFIASDSTSDEILPYLHVFRIILTIKRPWEIMKSRKTPPPFTGCKPESILKKSKPNKIWIASNKTIKKYEKKKWLNVKLNPFPIERKPPFFNSDTCQALALSVTRITIGIIIRTTAARIRPVLKTTPSSGDSAADITVNGIMIIKMDKRIIMILFINVTTRKDQKLDAPPAKNNDAEGFSLVLKRVKIPPDKKAFIMNPKSKTTDKPDTRDEIIVPRLVSKSAKTSILIPSLNSSVTMLFPRTLLTPALNGNARVVTRNKVIIQIIRIPFHDFIQRKKPDL